MLIFIPCCLACLASGCTQPSSSALRVATDWTPAETDRLPLPDDRVIVWIRVLPGDDPTRLLEADPAIDLVLGGPWASFQRLDHAGVWLKNDPRQGETPSIALVPLSRLAQTSGDPRRDPVARNTLRALLAGTPWPRAYARAMTHPLESIARSADSSSDPIPARLAFDPAAIPARAPRAAAARAWLDRLDPLPLDPDLQDAAQLEPWMIELAAATIAEPQADRQAVLARLAELPPRAQALLVEPPPWPPASLVRWRRRMDDGDAQVNAWFQNLARELAPIHSERAALSQSWLDPPRPIGPDRIRELIAPPAPDFLQNPRVRAWLHAEWSAWARQRYRRILRLIDPTLPTPNPTPGSARS
jgi:hypothetical protein